jgi:hypothetical protein
VIDADPRSEALELADALGRGKLNATVPLKELSVGAASPGWRHVFGVFVLGVPGRATSPVVPLLEIRVVGIV